MKINKSVNLFIFLSFSIIFGCKPTGEIDKVHQKKIESSLSNFGQLNYENVDHLVLMHQKASRQDIQFSKDSLQLAERMMREEGNLFPRVELEEAITSYPTPEIVIKFANGFLNIAQFYLVNEEATLKTPVGNNDIKWYLEGAHFYYKLATEFAEKIDKPFNKDINEKIILTMDCINQLLVDESFKDTNCCQKITP